MIHTTITPDNTDVHLSVPKNYVGRKLEVMVYPVDELLDDAAEKPVKKRPSEFAGTLSKEEGKRFRKYLKWSRS